VSALGRSDSTLPVNRRWKNDRADRYTDRSAFDAVTTVQIMVKDSKKYAATGDRGFGEFAKSAAF
jgi:hypothetical protein